MNNINRSIGLIVFCSLSVLNVFAYPRRASELMDPDNSGDISPRFYRQMLFFPHQVAICDLICTGTVLSTNDGYSAQFAIDDIVSGRTSSTNITIRRVDDSKTTGLVQNDRYLIMAFTNDWWRGDEELGEDVLLRIYNYPSITNQPSDHAVFNDCRIMGTFGGAINFNQISCGGTNFWEGTRAFITNFVDIAKCRNDERLAYETIYTLTHNKNDFNKLPPNIRKQIELYKYLRYDCENLPPPTNTVPTRSGIR